MNNLFCVVVLLGISYALAAPKPTTCNNYDCPSFTVVSSNDNYEERQYDSANWVTVEGTGGSAMFWKLFRYIGGRNADNKKIEMTAPVISRVQPNADDSGFSGNRKMSFYVAMENAPEPTEDGVYLEKKSLNVYVKTFGGWARDAKNLQKAAELRQQVPAGTFDSSYFYTAGYDSPWKVLNRHNEVWLVKN